MSSPSVPSHHTHLEPRDLVDDFLASDDEPTPIPAFLRLLRSPNNYMYTPIRWVPVKVHDPAEEAAYYYYYNPETTEDTDVFPTTIDSYQVGTST